MDVVTNSKEKSNEDKIWEVLEILKKQIDQYHFIGKDTKSKTELMRSEKIQKLVMEERYLTAQFEKIQKEIKRYEKKYEKILKKKVKTMREQIKEDRNRLETIKQKYHELNMKGNVAFDDEEKENEKEKEKKEKRKKAKMPKIRMKTMKPKFRQKTMPLSKRIKIKIKTNRKLGNRREMHFVNDNNVNNAQNTFTDLVKVVTPVTTNTRECKIILQRLTEEQMNRYFNRKRLGIQQRKRKRVTREFSEKANENGTAVANVKWNIKIPKSVLDESQKEIQNYDVSVAPHLKEVI